MFTQADLQELLSFEANGAQVVSLYLNTDVGQESREVIKLHAKNLLKELNGRLSDDVEAIEKYLEHSHDWNTQGLAIFSCAAKDFWRVVPTAVSFRNRIRVKAKPHVKPIAHLLDFYAHYGVILVDRVGARFFEFHLGELQATAGVMGEQVRKTKDGQGTTMHGGFSQVSGGRQVGETIQRNLRETAAAAVDFFANRPIRRLFLGGAPETIGLLREMLPKQLQSCIAGQFQIDMDASDREVREKSLALLKEANHAREQALVKQMIDLAAQGGQAVTGLDQTLRAVYEGRVANLIIGDGFRQGGYRYGETGYLSSHLVIDQPEAAGEPEPVEDVVEEAVNLTLQHSGHVEIISDNPDLEHVGHIGALLRY